MVLTCDNCGFIFSRVEETDQCPDCGKHMVRPADEAEQEKFAARITKLGRSEHTKAVQFPDLPDANTIRPMRLGDYHALFELWSQTPGIGLRTLDDSQEGIARFLRRNPATSFVACDGAKLIGAILCGHDGRRGYIYHTVVLPEYRRRGIASSLIDASIGALQQEGITRLCLNVMEQNEIGKRFWISKGWEKKDFLGFYSKAISEHENAPLFHAAERLPK